MYAYILYICLYIACMHTLMQTHLHVQRKYLRDLKYGQYDWKADPFLHGFLTICMYFIS